MNVKEIISNTTISKLLIPITAILLLVLTIRKRATIFLWFRKALSIINSTILFIATHIKILQKNTRAWIQQQLDKIRLLYSRIINAAKKIVKKTIEQCNIICKRIHLFFVDKKVLVFVILVNFLNIVANIVLYIRGTPLPISMLIFPLVGSIMFSFAFYSDIFFSWCNQGHQLIQTIVSFFFSIFSFLSPVISFTGLMYTSKIYFADVRNWYYWVIIAHLALLQFVCIFHYCYELHDIYSPKFSIRFRIHYFLYAIIHIVLIFAYLYMLILVFDHTALGNIAVTTPFELSCDLTFFSAMTFLGRDGLLSPESVLSKVVVLIESFIFTIYISIVLIGMLSSNQSNQPK